MFPVPVGRKGSDSLVRFSGREKGCPLGDDKTYAMLCHAFFDTFVPPRFTLYAKHHTPHTQTIVVFFKPVEDLVPP